MGEYARSVKIIGAGVAGLTAAAELVEHGFDVTIYDKADEIGAASCSWYAGGMLAPWCERESAEEPVARLGQEAANWWDDRTGLVVRTGSLVLAQPRDQADLARFSRRTEKFEWINSKNLDALEPDLSGRFKKALYFPTEAHLNPRDALLALAHYIKSKGAKLHFNADGYATDRTDITIDARGFSARDTLPRLRGVKGEMLIIKTGEITLSRPIRILHPRIPLYIVPRDNHHFMVGATMIESAERGRITARSMIELLSAAYALHPAFGEAEIIETGTDVRPAFADNLPHITHKNNIYYLNGLYRHGFLLSPALARMTVKAITGGKHIELFEAQKDARHEADHKRQTA